MSYSFTVVAPTKAEAKQKIAEQFGVVLQSQPVHEKDQAQAEAVAAAYMDLVADPADGEAITIFVSGYLSWSDKSGGEKHFVGSSINVNVRIGPAA